MAKRHKLRNFLLCDMVVVDVHNKHTLVGVYSNDIVVAEMPVRLPIALYGEFVPAQDGDHQIGFEFKMDGKIFGKLQVQLKITTTAEVVPITFPRFEAGIDRPLALSISATIDGGRAQEIVYKRVIHGAIPYLPNVLPPHSEQLPIAHQEIAGPRD